MGLSRLPAEGPIESAGSVFESEAKRVGARAAGSCSEVGGAGLKGPQAGGHVAQTNLLFGQIRRQGSSAVSAGAGAISGREF